MSTQPRHFFDHSRHKLRVANLNATLDILAFEGRECYAAMLEVTQIGLISTTEREAYALDRLRNACASLSGEARK